MQKSTITLHIKTHTEQKEGVVEDRATSLNSGMPKPDTGGERVCP